MEKRTRFVSGAVGTARTQQKGEGVGGEGAGGGAVKNETAECPHNRDRRSWWQCEGASICEHNHSLIRSACKLCKNSSICQHSEGGGAGGEMLEDKRQKETKHKRVSRQRERGGCGEERVCFVGGSRHGREGAAWGGSGRDGGRRRRCEEGARKVPAQLRTKHLQAMRRGGHLRAQPRKEVLQTMRRVGHLRAQPPKKLFNSLRT